MDGRLILLVCVVGVCLSKRLHIPKSKEKKHSRKHDVNPSCIHVDHNTNVTLRGGINAGKFIKRKHAKTVESCIEECCKDKSCDVAFKLGSSCYSVYCYTKNSCETIPTSSSDSPGTVHISHIIRKSDDTETDRKLPKKDIVTVENLPRGNNTCLFSRVAYNQTITGGIHSWQSMDLGKFLDVHDCADKCCNADNCKIAAIRGNTCYAVECFEKTYCESRDAPSTDENMNILVYMNIKNGNRQNIMDTCSKRCVDGICTNDKTCLCDAGVKGEHCDIGETDGKCDPKCGPHGKCNSFDKCVCDLGWAGYKCDEKIECNPPCKNGICVDSEIRQCKCRIGWKGLHCNMTTGDKSVLASKGEHVLFTHFEIEPELAIKIPAESPPLRGSQPVSAITVASCCGVASMLILIFVVISKTRQNRALRRQYLEAKSKSSVHQSRKGY